jgi:hypothetical protein
MAGFSRTGSGDASPSVVSGLFTLLLGGGIAALSARVASESIGSARLEIVAFLNVPAVGVAVCGGVLMAVG